MKMRLLAAVVLIPVLLVILFVAPPVVLAVAAGLVCAIASWELLTGTGLVKHIRLNVYTSCFAFCIPLWCYFGMQESVALIATFIYSVLLFGEILLSKGKLPFEKVAVCYVGAMVIPYLLSSLVRIMGDGSGRILIAIPFVLAFLADSGAYFIGCAWGKHKLAPVISPKKSVEGLFGGIAFAVAGMLLYCLIVASFFDAEVNYLYAFTYGVIGALCGTFGDLCFSAIKRQTGIKDYGKLIPGHGGMLDRLDSVIFVSALSEILLKLLPVVE